jgi:hypothetical protein
MVGRLDGNFAPPPRFLTLATFAGNTWPLEALVMKHRGISFYVTEMSFDGGWRWTVDNGRTVSVGVSISRTEAIRQARTFIDGIVDWAR